MIETVVAYIVLGARYLVAGAFGVALVVALTHWGVRSKRLSAFGGWARWVRRWSDPLLAPIERRVARSGGNPQDAPVWLVGIVLVAGLILIAIIDWIIGFVFGMIAAGQSGYLIPTLVRDVFEVLKLAVIIRVLASWINPSPYSWWMRVVRALTDWLIDPLRRIIPTIGMFDLSPLAAYFLLSFAEGLIERAFFQ